MNLRVCRSPTANAGSPSRTCTRRFPPGKSMGYERAESFTTVDDIVELLRCLERRRPGGSDGDALACLRVPPLARGARAGGERPEFRDGDGFVPGEASPMAAKTALTARSAATLGSATCPATCAARSALFMVSPPGADAHRQSAGCPFSACRFARWCASRHPGGQGPAAT